MEARTSLTISILLKMIIVPSQMGAGAGHDSGELKNFKKIHRTTEYAIHSAKHRCRAQSARGDGKWNEGSPLVYMYIVCSVLIPRLQISVVQKVALS